MVLSTLTFIPNPQTITSICCIIVPIPPKAIRPFGVATGVRRNCSTPETFEKRSREYQDYLINYDYNSRKVQQQFNKVKSIPRDNLPTHNIRENILFISSGYPILRNNYLSRSSYVQFAFLAKIFPKGSIIPSFRRTKNTKEILAGSKHSNCTTPEIAPNQGCFKCKGKCDLYRNYLKET